MAKTEFIKSSALKDVLAREDIKTRLKEILGNRAPQFAAALVQIQSRSWQLQKCNPMSILGSAITAAALDLSVDPQLGEAHLVPYKDTCTFQLGYIGLGQLAIRSGQYKRLGWVVVHEGELQHYDELSGELEIDSAKRTSDEVIGYAAKFTLVTGYERGEYWTKERCEKHAERYSQAYRAGLRDKDKRDSPWWTDFDRMALKTVLKSLLRTWGPKSIQMRQAVIADEAAIDVGGEVQGYPDNQGVNEPVKPEFDGPPMKQAAAEVTTKKETSPHSVEAILKIATAKKIEEAELLDYLYSINAIEGNERTLATLPESVIKMLGEQISDIGDQINGKKGQPKEQLL